MVALELLASVLRGDDEGGHDDHNGAERLERGLQVAVVWPPLVQDEGGGQGNGGADGKALDAAFDGRGVLGVGFFAGNELK